MTLIGLALYLVASLLGAMGQRRSFGVIMASGALSLLIDCCRMIATNNYPTIAYGMAYTPLSAFFGIIFAIGSLAAVLYGFHYLKAYEHGINLHLFCMGFLIFAMHLCLIARNSIIFFGAWELMSISSFFCIILEDKPDTLKAALYYMGMMQIGAFILLLGFAFAYAQYGSFDFGVYKNLGALPMLLLAIGFAFKAGFFPLYSWLPIAHPAAPAHISGLMSGIMLKTGIFGILLISKMGELSTFAAYIFGIVAIFGAASGILHALAETDIKKILAYSSIENIGIIGFGIALGTIGQQSGNALMAWYGYAGALLHSLNHALMKPLLFFLSGNVYQQCHSRELDDLGGLQKQMPLSGILFLAGSLAISAMPLFNGFVSELMIYLGLLQGFEPAGLALSLFSILGAALLAGIGALALFAFVRMYALAFLGEARKPHLHSITDVKANMNIVPISLAVLCLLLGLLAYPLMLLVSPVIEYMGLEMVDLGFSAGNLFRMNLALVSFALLAVLLYLIRSKKTKSSSITWGCAYEAPSPKLQYSANSFIHPLSYFMKPLIKKRDTASVGNEYFPSELHFESKVHDYLEDHILMPLKKAWQKLLGLFSGLQGGNTRAYITYGMIFLIILLLWASGGVK